MITHESQKANESLMMMIMIMIMVMVMVLTRSID